MNACIVFVFFLSHIFSFVVRANCWLVLRKCQLCARNFGVFSHGAWMLCTLLDDRYAAIKAGFSHTERMCGRGSCGENSCIHSACSSLRKTRRTHESVTSVWLCAHCTYFFGGHAQRYVGNMFVPVSWHPVMPVPWSKHVCFWITRGTQNMPSVYPGWQCMDPGL